MTSRRLYLERSQLALCDVTAIVEPLTTDVEAAVCCAAAAVEEEEEEEEEESRL